MSRLPPRPAQPLWVIVGIVAVAAWAGMEWWKKSAPAGAPVSGLARAVDGDSLEIGSERIRLFGIDAPELRQLCQLREAEVTCGFEARDALAALVRGRTVTCTPEEAERSYDRLVAVCRVTTERDGTIDLSEKQVRDGHAIELLSHSHGRYASAEREAKDAKRGIWAGRFERPSEWRQRMGR
jgi:endonuclease YncB( thermonuclease family)